MIEQLKVLSSLTKISFAINKKNTPVKKSGELSRSGGGPVQKVFKGTTV